MLIITNNPDKYKAESKDGHTVVWALSLNTGAEWAQKRHPDRGFINYRDLYGKSKGSCLILGYGPSRTKFSRERFDGPVFAINRAVEVCPDAEYWCAHDLTAILSHAKLRADGSTLVTQGGTTILPQFDETTSRFRRVLIDAVSQPSRWPKETSPLYWNETTFGWTLHLAIRMGFDRINTLGVDLSTGGYSHPKFDDVELARQHEGVKHRTLLMFGPTEIGEWYDRPVKIVDYSGGALPVEKASI